AIADDLEMPTRGPEEDRGAAIPAVQRHPGVAGIAFEVLLGRLPLAERLGIEQLVLLDIQLAERQPVTFGVAPVVRSEAGLVDLPHLVTARIALPVITPVIAVPPPPPPI